MLPLFVYGTLKPGGSNYGNYLAGRTSAAHPAWLVGAALYTEGLYPYLVIMPDRADTAAQVYGVLITLRPEYYTLTLAQIDHLEDYIPGDPRSLYERITHPVQTDVGQINAWVYIAGPPVRTDIRDGRLSRLHGGIWHSQQTEM